MSDSPVANAPTSLTDSNMGSSTASSTAIWDGCLNYLRDEIASQEFNTWIRPLHAVQKGEGQLQLLAPNRYFIDWITDRYLDRINELLAELSENEAPKLSLEIGSKTKQKSAPSPNKPTPSAPVQKTIVFNDGRPVTNSNLNQNMTLESFVKGQSNQIALTAAMHVAKTPGKTYNPLSIYGGVGLGKTHLAQGIGHYVLQQNPSAKVLYLHSERFVADMIKALQRNAMNEFKRYYRNIDVLIVDDIQFFAGKERSQEEFFHTFNALLDAQQQIVLTCDRFPKEISGLEERLQSRFGWGLTVAVEPPELETRIAILKAKAIQSNTPIKDEVAYFIAKHIQSNVRELEGALKRVIANAHFTGNDITVEFARDALKDLLTLQAKLVTIENIQKTVADHYKIKVSDLLSKRRSRSIARPRQIAMALAKQLTTHSLPEIGDAFGGRDHTTVIHACRKVEELLGTHIEIQENFKILLRILSA